MAKKHSPDQYAAWARDWGIDGFDHWDPKLKEKARQRALKYSRQKQEKHNKPYKNEKTFGSFFIYKLL